MYILTCQHCGKDCGYYLDSEDVKIFCSKDCLIAFGFKRQTHSGLEVLNDVGYFHSTASSFDSFTEGQRIAPMETKANHNESTDAAYVQKTGTETCRVISALAETPYDIRLTQRQFDILKLVAEGKSNTEIAQHFYLGKRTIESHIHTLLQVTNLKNRTLLAVFYTENEDNICVKKQPQSDKVTCHIKQPLFNPAYKKIEALCSQGVSSISVVAHMVDCSESYARSIINKLNRKNAESYFSKRLKSGIGE